MGLVIQRIGVGAQGPHGAFDALTEPTAEPLTLAEAKIVLRIDDAYQDAIIAAQIVAARQQVELDTGRWVAQALYRFYADCPAPSGLLTIPRGPVTSVTLITVADPLNVQTTVPSSAYTLDLASVPARILFGSPTGSPAWWPTGPVRPLQGLAVDLVGGEAPSPAWAVQACRLLLEAWRLPHAGPETLAAYHDLIAGQRVPGVA